MTKLVSSRRTVGRCTYGISQFVSAHCSANSTIWHYRLTITPGSYCVTASLAVTLRAIVSHRPEGCSNGKRFSSATKTSQSRIAKCHSFVEINRKFSHAVSRCGYGVNNVFGRYFKKNTIHALIVQRWP